MAPSGNEPVRGQWKKKPRAHKSPRSIPGWWVAPGSQRRAPQRRSGRDLSAGGPRERRTFPLWTEVCRPLLQVRNRKAQTRSSAGVGLYGETQAPAEEYTVEHKTRGEKSRPDRHLDVREGLACGAPCSPGNIHARLVPLAGAAFGSVAGRHLSERAGRCGHQGLDPLIWNLLTGRLL